MKKLITILGILLLLTSCSNPQDLQRIEELENQISEIEQKEQETQDDFAKKIECANLDINSDIKENWGAFAEKYDIEEIFYSSSENTCIGIITLIENNHREIWAYNILEKDWFLSYLTSKTGICYFYYNGESDIELTNTCLTQKKIFDERIQKLKN